MRVKNELYPDFSAELKWIEKNGVQAEIVNKIIEKHSGNSEHNRKLYDRYRTMSDAVPIFERQPRFKEEGEKPINNRVNNDFFSEIIDIKVGYFAGKAAVYSYSTTDESEEMTGGNEALELASKTLSDFVTRNNLYDVTMENTKLSAICGYSGRLFYVDEEGNERVMAVMPHETAILYTTEMTEPKYGIRYYTFEDLDGSTTLHADVYTESEVISYEGQLGGLKESDRKPHLFDYCPLQGIPNNKELLGDAEKVLAEIDAYDRTLSDASNDIESFSSAYMVFKNLNISPEERKKAHKSGSFQFQSGMNNSDIYFLTKNPNDTQIEHHLDRLENNIYRFSKTPNLSDENFGTASGIALRFRITGLETKCGMFEAKMTSANTYMFKVLASAWGKKQIAVDPLQCFTQFKRNFPLDTLNEAQTVQALINCGIPEEIAFRILSFIDDIDEVMDLIEEKKSLNPPPLDLDDDEDVDDEDDDSTQQNE